MRVLPARRFVRVKHEDLDHAVWVEQNLAVVGNDPAGQHILDAPNELGSDYGLKPKAVLANGVLLAAPNHRLFIARHSAAHDAEHIFVVQIRLGMRRASTVEVLHRFDHGVRNAGLEREFLVLSPVGRVSWHGTTIAARCLTRPDPPGIANRCLGLVSSGSNLMSVATTVCARSPQYQMGTAPLAQIASGEGPVDRFSSHIGAPMSATTASASRNRDALRGSPAVGDEHGRRLSTETKAAFKTTEFAAFIVMVVGILISAAVAKATTTHHDPFTAAQAWLYVSIVTVGYMLSRGLAKSGTKQPYDER